MSDVTAIEKGPFLLLKLTTQLYRRKTMPKPWVLMYIFY